MVFGLERTGSTSALKFLLANYQDTHEIHRQHGVSPRFRDFIHRGEAMGLPHFDIKERRLDDSLAALERARKVLIIVTLREPVARVISLFQYRNRHRLLDYFDEASGGFRCADQIAADLESLGWSEAVRQRHWFAEELQAAFGYDLREAPPRLEDGPCAFAVSRCEHAGADLMAAVAPIGHASHPPKRRNGVQSRGPEAVIAGEAFQRQFRLSEALTDALWDNRCLRRFYERAGLALAV